MKLAGIWVKPSTYELKLPVVSRYLPFTHHLAGTKPERRMNETSIKDKATLHKPLLYCYLFLPQNDEASLSGLLVQVSILFSLLTAFSFPLIGAENRFLCLSDFYGLCLCNLFLTQLNKRVYSKI